VVKLIKERPLFYRDNNGLSHFQLQTSKNESLSTYNEKFLLKKKANQLKILRLPMMIFG